MEKVEQVSHSKSATEMWVIFILNPFLSLLFALKNFRYPTAKNIVWAFTVFYGFTYVISYETMDSNRYKDSFVELSKKSLTFSEFTSTLYDVESMSIDILNPLIQYVLSRVTDDFRILFAVYGLVFGFFYSRNIWYVLDRLGGELKLVVLPIVIAFAFISPIWDITGFRFCVSQHIFLFGALPFLFEKKKIYLIFPFLTIFVHFAFIFPVAILLVYMILGNRLNLFFIFFIFTMFISDLNVEVIRDGISNNLPTIFQQRTSGYTSEQRLESYKEAKASTEKNWYARLYQLIFKWVMVAFIVAIFFRGKQFILHNKSILNLMCFTLFLYGCANISSLMPSGGRFTNLANLFTLAFIVLYIQRGPKETFLKKLIPLSIPAFLLYIIVTLRIGFDTIGVFTILSNPITILFFNGDVALINIVKGVF